MPQVLNYSGDIIKIYNNGSLICILPNNDRYISLLNTDLMIYVVRENGTSFSINIKEDGILKVSKDNYCF
jgi:hypothetical protein